MPNCQQRAGDGWRGWPSQSWINQVRRWEAVRDLHSRCQEKSWDFLWPTLSIQHKSSIFAFFYEQKSTRKELVECGIAGGYRDWFLIGKQENQGFQMEEVHQGNLPSLARFLKASWRWAARDCTLQSSGLSLHVPSVHQSSQPPSISESPLGKALDYFNAKSRSWVAPSPGWR